MSDQPFLPVLTTLLDHPEFQEGLQEGMATFVEGMFEEDFEKAWTKDDIIEFVDSELSKAVYRRSQRVGQAFGWSMPSYLMHLGYTMSYLALMLSAKANQKQQEQQGR